MFAGQPVALVVAESEALAADGAELVEVELETLQPVLDLEAATRPGSPRARVDGGAGRGSDLGDAHASVSAGGVGESEELSENVLDSARLTHGDVDAALAASHVVVRGTFTTPWMYQGYLEPQTATAWLEPDGELVLSSSTQAPFATRDSLATLFGLPADRVRVRGTPLGGAFGGKIGIIEPPVAAAALVLRRPVRLTMTRSEDIAATNPAGAEVMSVELGADADGHSTGFRPRARRSRRHRGLRRRVDRRHARRRRLPMGCTRADRARRRHQPVTYGAYRAPTAAPAAFAVESLIDELAGQLARDPLELRLRTWPSRAIARPPASRSRCSAPVSAWSACVTIRCGRSGTLPDGEGIGVAPDGGPGARAGRGGLPSRRRRPPDDHHRSGRHERRRVGLRHHRGRGLRRRSGPRPGRLRRHLQRALCRYERRQQGHLHRRASGQRAATEARERLLAVAAEELEITPEDLEIVDGSVQPLGVPAKALPIDELASKILSFGSRHPPVEGHGRSPCRRRPSARPISPMSASIPTPAW